MTSKSERLTVRTKPTAKEEFDVWIGKKTERLAWPTPLEHWWAESAYGNAYDLQQKRIDALESLNAELRRKLGVALQGYEWVAANPTTNAIDPHYYIAKIKEPT